MGIFCIWLQVRIGELCNQGAACACLIHIGGTRNTYEGGLRLIVFEKGDILRRYAGFPCGACTGFAVLLFDDRIPLA